MRKSNSSKKSATKKSAAKKAAPKKATAARKSAAPKKAATKKSTPNKTTMPRKSAMPQKSSSGRSAMRSKPVDDRSMIMELFQDSLKDIYWAEKNLVKALAKMQKEATSDELKNAFAEHREVTITQAERLEEVFGLLGKKAQAKKCEAMAGLIEEANSIIEETDKGTATRDVGLIMAAQKVEHYEIASYGSMAQLAKTLGLTEIKDILGSILDEEKETDELLTQVAETSINLQAAGEGEDDEMEEEEEEEA